MATELLAVGVAFLALAVAGWVAVRVGLSVVPFYVAAGLVVGPNVAGALGLPYVPNGDVASLFGELGIVFLLFFLGLEFTPERLLAARRRIVRAGVIDLAVNFPIGFVLGLLLGWSPLAAILLGGIVYVSSSAIITKSLVDLGWIADPESEPILGVLVFEDLVVALYLAVVTPLVLGGSTLAETGSRVAVALGFLLVLAVVAVAGTRAFEATLTDANSEAVVLRVLGVTVSVAGAALALGVSEAVAAFFVGMAFSTTGHVERIERQLTAIRDAFAAAFFFWIGLGTKPSLVVGVAGVLVLAVLLTAPAKVASGYLGGRAFDLSRHRSFRSGVGLVTRGEFSLIIAAIAVEGSGEVLTQTIPALAVGYVLVMGFLGTLSMQYSDVLERSVFRGSWGSGERS